MQPLRVLSLYLLAVFTGGALLAPWLYWAADWTGLITGTPRFHAYIVRSVEIAALVGIWPLVRSCRIDSWKAVGLQYTVDWSRQLGRGFFLGFISLGFVAAAALASGARVWDAHLQLSSVAAALAGAIATAIVIALLEEFLFRGVIFGAFRQFNSWFIALGISSAVYAIVHFFEKPAIVPTDVKWSSGLALLPEMLRGFGNVERLVPAFFVLCLVGAILGTAYQRSGSLYYSIGLHAGWIFWLKSYGVLTARGETATQLWGTARLIDGWFTVAVLAAILLWFLRSSTFGCRTGRWSEDSQLDGTTPSRV
jgi:membrane protease YdiL (CAAX protease family)